MWGLVILYTLLFLWLNYDAYKGTYMDQETVIRPAVAILLWPVVAILGLVILAIYLISGIFYVPGEILRKLK